VASAILCMHLHLHLLRIHTDTISFLWAGLLYNCVSIYGNIYIRNTAGEEKCLSGMRHRQEKTGDEQGMNDCTIEQDHRTVS
jgi:hypothetical protein